MNRLKIFAEIFVKSLLFMAIAVAALVVTAYAGDLFKSEGITHKSIALMLMAITLLTMIILPRLPTSYHNLVCKPAEKTKNLASTER